MIILLTLTGRVILAIVLIIALFLSLHIKYNQKNEIAIVERLGKFNRLIEHPSFFFLIPFIDRVLERISTKEIVDARRFSYMKDDQLMKYNVTIRYTVFDPKLFSYASIDALGSIVDLIKTAKENELTEEELDLQMKSYGRDLGLTIINYQIE